MSVGAGREQKNSIELELVFSFAVAQSTTHDDGLESRSGTKKPPGLRVNMLAVKTADSTFHTYISESP